jgi:hypothetical protein
LLLDLVAFSHIQHWQYVRSKCIDNAACAKIAEEQVDKLTKYYRALEQTWQAFLAEIESISRVKSSVQALAANVNNLTAKAAATESILDEIMQVDDERVISNETAKQSQEMAKLKLSYKQEYQQQSKKISEAIERKKERMIKERHHILKSEFDQAILLFDSSNDANGSTSVPASSSSSSSSHAQSASLSDATRVSSTPPLSTSMTRKNSLYDDIVNNVNALFTLSIETSTSPVQVPTAASAKVIDAGSSSLAEAATSCSTDHASMDHMDLP